MGVHEGAVYLISSCLTTLSPIDAPSWRHIKQAMFAHLRSHTKITYQSFSSSESTATFVTLPLRWGPYAIDIVLAFFCHFCLAPLFNQGSCRWEPSGGGSLLGVDAYGYGSTVAPGIRSKANPWLSKPQGKHCRPDSLCLIMTRPVNESMISTKYLRQGHSARKTCFCTTASETQKQEIMAIPNCQIDSCVAGSAERGLHIT